MLFELGLRQAFDKPVVLIQEVGTPKIFDIAPLRFTEYRPARIYHEVIEDQEKIAAAVVATREAFAKGAGVNSIVRILALTRPAALPEVSEANRDPALQLVRAELSELRNELRRAVTRPSIVPTERLDAYTREAVRRFAEAVEAAEQADRSAIAIDDIERLRERAFATLLTWQESGAPMRKSTRIELDRAEAAWLRVLERVLAKPETAG